MRRRTTAEQEEYSRTSPAQRAEQDRERIEQFAKTNKVGRPSKVPPTCHGCLNLRKPGERILSEEKETAAELQKWRCEVWEVFRANCRSRMEAEK